MKLRLYHHPDGARIAYRETGTGPPLALLHSQGLTHREWEPVVDELAHRYRLVLPDLPLHGASEDRPSHPYSPEWLTGLVAAFLLDTCGARPLVAGHGTGAQLALRAVASGALTPARLVLLPSALHTAPRRTTLERVARTVVRAAVVPGCDRLLARAAPLVLRPSLGDRLTATGAPGARDLVRHATIDLGGNGNRVRSLARAARRWPRGEQAAIAAAYAAMGFPVLLLWADADPLHPLAIAEAALPLLPDAQLRVLERTGFLVAYDDPVGVARELLAFCG